MLLLGMKGHDQFLITLSRLDALIADQERYCNRSVLISLLRYLSLVGLCVAGVFKSRPIQVTVSVTVQVTIPDLSQSSLVIK